MERQRPRSERARRNRMNSAFLMQRRSNPQYRLKLINERHLSVGENLPLPSQTNLFQEKNSEQLDS